MLEEGGSGVCGHPQLFSELKTILQNIRLYLTNPSEWVWAQSILPKANVCRNAQEPECPSYWCSILEMSENHLGCRGLLFQFLFSVSSLRQKWSNTRSSRAWTRCAAPLSMVVYILVHSSFPIIFIIDKGVLLVKQSFCKYASVKQSVCHLLLLRLKGLFPQGLMSGRRDRGMFCVLWPVSYFVAFLVIWQVPGPYAWAYCTVH